MGSHARDHRSGHHRKPPHPRTIKHKDRWRHTSRRSSRTMMPRHRGRRCHTKSSWKSLPTRRPSPRGASAASHVRGRPRSRRCASSSSTSGGQTTVRRRRPAKALLQSHGRALGRLLYFMLGSPAARRRSWCVMTCCAPPSSPSRYRPLAHLGKNNCKASWNKEKILLFFGINPRTSTLLRSKGYNQQSCLSVSFTRQSLLLLIDSTTLLLYIESHRFLYVRK